MLLCALLLGPSIPAQEIWVSASAGDDTAPGTREQPLATLQAAQARVRRRLADGARGWITVWLRGGDYRLHSSWVLEARDSGPAGARISYRGVPKERVRLLGSVRLPRGAFHGVEPHTEPWRRLAQATRAEVRVIDLAAQGLAELAPIRPRGFPLPVRPAPAELCIEGRPMTRARWPNEGFAKVGRVLEPGAAPSVKGEPFRRPVFSFEGDRPARWRKARDPWLHGYWKYDWADESIRIERIDLEAKTITLADPHRYGLVAGARYRAENMLAELDTPGEYVIDRKTRKLYLLPPAGFDAGTEIELTTLAGPLISMQDVSRVTLRGLELAQSRGDGIRIQGGEAVHIEGCRFAALGNRAVVIEGGRAHAIVSCDVRDTGEGGFSISGGDRATLTPCHHEVRNCDVAAFSRRVPTYRPAVRIAGVGVRVIGCHLHDAPHAAILFGGNDHRIERNLIEKVLRQTGDGGAVYCGRDWTLCGTVIRHNLFRDLAGISRFENAVYLDDQASGISVRGNVFQRCHWGMLVGGGRRNVIEGNLFVDCGKALHLDARGLGWARRMAPTLRQRLAAMPVASAVWRRRYPWLAELLQDEPMVPKGNVVRRNVLIRSGSILDDVAAPAREHGVFSKNRASKARVLRRDGSLDPEAIGRLLSGSESIPLAEIGVRRDALRAEMARRRE